MFSNTVADPLSAGLMMIFVLVLRPRSAWRSFLVRLSLGRFGTIDSMSDKTFSKKISMAGILFFGGIHELLALKSWVGVSSVAMSAKYSCRRMRLKNSLASCLRDRESILAGVGQKPRPLESRLFSDGDSV